MADYQYLTVQGVIVPDTSDILTGVQTEYTDVFGADLVLSPDTPQGVLITAEALRKQNFTLETREAATVPGGKGFLVVGRQQIDKKPVRKFMLFAAFPELTALVTAQIPDAAKPRYPDARIRESLRTVAMRQSVPDEEQLALLPFKVSDRAGFAIRWR